MAAYTNINQTFLIQLITAYRLGELESFAAVSAGVTNSNYFVTTSRGEYFLTIFESLKRENLPFYIKFTNYLVDNSIPCAQTLMDCSGECIQVFNGKPLVIAKRLAGTMVTQPAAGHCWQLGIVLARMHNVAQSFPLKHFNQRGAEWHRKTAKQVLPVLNSSDQNILCNTIKLYESLDLSSLPQSVIHADLFRDNVLFDDNSVSGLIDFYYAYNGPCIYDLAVTFNDWCMKDELQIDPVNSSALLEGYQSVRKLSQQELDLWPQCLQLAALRFWLSRLQDKYFPFSENMTFHKEPDEFKQILLLHIGTV